MNLFIDTTATDLTVAAVTSVTDPTAVGELKQLVLGDQEPLVVDFTDGSAAPAWASDATYVLTAALGIPTSGGLLDLASTSTFTLAGSTRTGSLDLSGAGVADYVRLHLCNYPVAQRALRVALQLRIATPAGAHITYAQLPVMLQASVI